MDDIFSKDPFDAKLDLEDAIELEPGSKFSNCKVYLLSPNVQDELHIFLQESLQTRHIYPFKPPMAFSLFPIKKKHGNLKLVQSYQALGAMMVKNHYPTPYF